MEHEVSEERAKVDESQKHIADLQTEVVNSRAAVEEAHTELVEAEQFHKQELAALGRAVDKATREMEEAALVHNAELETERCRHAQEVRGEWDKQMELLQLVRIQ